MLIRLRKISIRMNMLINFISKKACNVKAVLGAVNQVMASTKA